MEKLLKSIIWGVVLSTVLVGNVSDLLTAVQHTIESHEPLFAMIHISNTIPIAHAVEH